MNGGRLEAFIWTPNGAFVLRDLPPGFPLSRAFAISGTNLTVVGEATFVNKPFQAFRWTPSEGMVGLGILPGQTSSSSLGISFDTSIIVGGGGSSPSPKAFIWDAACGMRDLKDVLKSLGADVDGWALEQATGVSHDGTTIVGNGINPAGNR